MVWYGCNLKVVWYITAVAYDPVWYVTAVAYSPVWYGLAVAYGPMSIVLCFAPL